MAPSTSNLIQEEQLSHQLTAIGYGEQQQAYGYHALRSIENHAETAASQDVDGVLFKSEPYVEIYDAFQVPENPFPSQPSIETRAKTWPKVDKTPTKKHKVAKQPTKEAMVEQPWTPTFALQKWADTPSDQGPFFLLQDYPPNRIYDDPAPQELPWNFLEGQGTDQQPPNGSAQDELVRGFGSWAWEET